MAGIEEGIQALLNAHADIGVAGIKSFLVKGAQEDASKYVTYRDTSQERDQLQSGAGLPTVRFEFNCYAADPEESRDLRDAVVDAMAEFQGVVAGIEIVDVTEENRRHFYDPDSELFRAIVDFSILWRECP